MKSGLLTVAFTLGLLLLLLGACARPVAVPESDARNLAENFVKKEATFTFDGMPETLRLVNTKTLDNGWEFTYEFDSQHSGYGDQTGQILIQVITPHRAVVTVEQAVVSRA